MSDKVIEEPVKGQATIFDVATLCGLSRGTVDRVIHNRGRVSQENKDKVNRAISILGYRPNPNASLLASKKTLTFACLIPKFKPGEYWEKVHEGFVEGARQKYSYNVRMEYYLYDQTDPNSFVACTRKILESEPAGVIMNAVFYQETAEFASRLDEDEIPYAFVDNKFDDLNYSVYYGAEPYKSGQLGAFLLTNHNHPAEIALVRLIRDKDHKADPNKPRRKGFLDYIVGHFPDCKIHTLFINPKDTKQICRTLDEFFTQNPQVKHIAMTNSRIHLIDEYLRRSHDKERTVVGFDDLEANLSCLKEGRIEYLVTRRIPVQAQYVLNAMIDIVTQGVKPAKRNNFLHLDILHRLNLDDY